MDAVTQAWPDGLLLEAAREGERVDDARLLIPAIQRDGSLFPIGKMAAHQSGQLHLAVSVFVFDEAGALLIQQRALGKYHCAGLWANTCCSHPHWGEPVAQAARRRLYEELGLRVALTPAGVLDYRAEVTNGLVEHERVHVFAGQVRRAEAALRLDPAEVSGVRWRKPEALMIEARARPDDFAPWFKIYLSRWNELGLS
jgi:isopentenyl-diphosphate delta-isomerase